MTDAELAKAIYDCLEGGENVLQASNCMTRLRVQLRKKDEQMLASLKSLEGVLGLNDTETELQIVLGPGKATRVTDAFRALLKKRTPEIGDGKALREQLRAQNATPIKLLFKRIAGIFIPLIPGFIACGLITGCTGVAIKLFPEIAAYPIVQLLAVAGNAVFWGMNLFVGYNAAKVFGGTPILGGTLAAVISHPGLSSIALALPFSGEATLVPGRGGVISVLLVAALGAWLEKRLHRIVPEMFDLFLTPLFTVLLAGAAAIFLLQPLGGILSDTIGAAATNAIGSGGAAVGFLLAGFWLPMVMFGIHQAITPIHVDLIAQYGVTILLPILAMAGAGQVGASLAVYFKTKNRFLKKTIASALPVGMMGIGEPLIYGVTFPLGRPFVGACIGGAFGGALQASFMVGAATLGISGLPLAGATDHIAVYLSGLLTAYAVGFIATWLLGFEDPEEQGMNASGGDRA